MSTLIYIKKYGKIIGISVLTLVSLPLIQAIVKIIFIYGNYVGTFARSVIEGGICF